MKKVIICGSMSTAEEILRVQTALLEKGYSVEILVGVKHVQEWEGESTGTEKAERKIKHDLIRGYYEKMKDYDIVLVVNPEKKGIKGYIGGNALIEMAFAHILNKSLYVLYKLPELSYSSELLAMQPIVLNGNLSKIV